MRSLIFLIASSAPVLLTGPRPLAAAECQAQGGQDAPASRASAPSSKAAAQSRPQSAPRPYAPFAVRGRLTSRYYLRGTSDASDQDLYETLSLEVGDPKRDPVTGYLLGRFAADLDGREEADSPFASLDDTFDHGVLARVYDAYADVHVVPGLEMLRGGRQLVYETPEVVAFDGVRAETEELGPAKVQFGGYGGVATHFYESSARNDKTFGAHAKVRPWKSGRLRVDWMHFEDERLLGQHEDQLFGAHFWQTFGRSLHADLAYTRLEDRDRDVRARMDWSNGDAGTTVAVSYYQLLRTRGELVLELDPFFSALREERPYHQYGLLASQRLSEHVTLEGGLDLRRLRDRSDAGEFNRDYDRGHATLRVDDLGLEGLSLGATGDLWSSDGQQVQTWGFDATQKLAQKWRAELGSYYSLYKFDLLLNRERDHVRTYYAKVRHDASKALAFTLSYELEDSTLDTYSVFLLEALWRF